MSTSMMGLISPELLICLDDFSSTSHSRISAMRHMLPLRCIMLSYHASLSLAFLFLEFLLMCIQLAKRRANVQAPFSHYSRVHPRGFLAATARLAQMFAFPVTFGTLSPRHCGSTDVFPRHGLAFESTESIFALHSFLIFIARLSFVRALMDYPRRRRSESHL